MDGGAMPRAREATMAEFKLPTKLELLEKDLQWATDEFGPDDPHVRAMKQQLDEMRHGGATRPLQFVRRPGAAPKPPVVAAPLPAAVRRIAREEMLALPIRRYEGPVQVVAELADFRDALPDILQEGIVGFDTETRPAFRPGESYLPSLVQLATAKAVYLLQVRQKDLFDGLREILASGTIVKVGVSVANDLRNLKKLFDFDERSVVDLGMVAERHGVQQTGVRNLAGIFLGTRIPKGAKITNWAARRLTPQQIAYAATDAWVCRELYLRFRELAMV
jgi:hypothetical protein